MFLYPCLDKMARSFDFCISNITLPSSTMSYWYANVNTLSQKLKHSHKKRVLLWGQDSSCSLKYYGGSYLLSRIRLQYHRRGGA